MRLELCNCEGVLLEEIAHPKMYRKDVAQTYSLALRSSERDAIDWKKVNLAIIKRWSVSGLQWIKTQAHNGKCFDVKKIKARFKPGELGQINFRERDEI